MHKISLDKCNNITHNTIYKPTNENRNVTVNKCVVSA